MNVSEELRRMLDERGIEYSIHEDSWAKETYWIVNHKPYRFSERSEYGTCVLHDITPEQAIAATLGDGEYESRMDALLCRLTNGKWSKSRSYSVDFMVSCVDEAYEDAALGGGECENIAQYPLVNFECSECGCAVYGGDELGANIRHGEWNRCPNCERKIRKAVKR